GRPGTRPRSAPGARGARRGGAVEGGGRRRRTVRRARSAGRLVVSGVARRRRPLPPPRRPAARDRAGGGEDIGLLRSRAGRTARAAARPLSRAPRRRPEGADPARGDPVVEPFAWAGPAAAGCR